MAKSGPLPAAQFRHLDRLHFLPSERLLFGRFRAPFRAPRGVPPTMGKSGPSRQLNFHILIGSISYRQKGYFFIGFEHLFEPTWGTPHNGQIWIPPGPVGALTELVQSPRPLKLSSGPGPSRLACWKMLNHMATHHLCVFLTFINKCKKCCPPRFPKGPVTAQ